MQEYSLVITELVADLIQCQLLCVVQQVWLSRSFRGKTLRRTEFFPFHLLQVTFLNQCPEGRCSTFDTGKVTPQHHGTGPIGLRSGSETEELNGQAALSFEW